MELAYVALAGCTGWPSRPCIELATCNCHIVRCDLGLFSTSGRSWISIPSNPTCALTNPMSGIFTRVSGGSVGDGRGWIPIPQLGASRVPQAPAYGTWPVQGQIEPNRVSFEDSCPIPNAASKEGGSDTETTHGKGQIRHEQSAQRPLISLISLWYVHTIRERDGADRTGGFQA